jgi:hypothetical protein
MFIYLLQLFLLMTMVKKKGIDEKIASATIQDPMETIKNMVRDTGEVSEELGGFLIQVKDPDKFPWGSVLRYLLSLNHDVWVDSRDGSICIVTCPKAD